MIRRIGSDLQSFKTLSFESGLNIILADKSEGASDRQSRNGAGKTSFVELVHFVLGSNAGPDSIFRSSALIEQTFNLTTDISGNEFSIARSGKKPSRIMIDGPVQNLPIKSKFNKLAGVYELSNENWKDTLGSLWFGLNVPPGEAAQFQPTYRSLFSYYARRQSSGAFQEPTRQFSRQQLWDQQVVISYLLGLDWKISRNFQVLRGEEKVAKELGRAVSSGNLGSYFGRAADIRTRLAVVTRHVKQFKKQLKDFQIVPEYRSLEAEANEITSKINHLGEENFFDGNLIRNLKASLEEEDAPKLGDLDKLYAEAGVVLPELLRRRFNEVEVFHRTIIENRRSHLNSEITAAESRIESREQKKQNLDIRRQQIMHVLRSGGALEQYTAMREELGRNEAEVDTLRQRLETAEMLESRKTELEMRRNRLSQALRDDIYERKEYIEEAIVVFEELSEELYERAGSLTIDATLNGPKFEVKIESQRSKGITNMQIFCFDLMLAELSHSRGRSPGFLIHDSHLFDGVDERQVAKALQLGAEHAEKCGFQYIVTMNSDALPTDGFRRNFNINEYVIENRLTDATETGGLFGLRF